MIILFFTIIYFLLHLVVYLVTKKINAEHDAYIEELNRIIDHQERQLAERQIKAEHQQIQKSYQTHYQGQQNNDCFTWEVKNN